MSKVNELHNRAMDLAELGLIERLRGNPEGEVNYSRQALEFEAAAAQALTDQVEPTFSVLHRSAATLALRCGEFRQAEQLAAKALAEDPPNEIAEELRDVLEQVQFHRHLELRGVELGPDEVQMSLSGSGVGYGLIAVDGWASRIGDVSTFIERIVEWQQELPYAPRHTREETKEDFPVLVSAPRAASFAVTLRVGRLEEQSHHPIEIRSIFDEFMDLMEMFDHSDNLAMKERVAEPQYLRAFNRLAKKIAPDGERVRQVGFTVERGNVPRHVSVTRPAIEVTSLSFAESKDGRSRDARRVKVRGTLRHADFTSRERKQIKIVDDKGKRTTVRVSRDMTSEIVRTMWDMKVVVSGFKRGRSIYLENIEPDRQN